MSMVLLLEKSGSDGNGDGGFLLAFVCETLSGLITHQLISQILEFHIINYCNLNFFFFLLMLWKVWKMKDGRLER